MELQNKFSTLQNKFSTLLNSIFEQLKVSRFSSIHLNSGLSLVCSAFLRSLLTQLLELSAEDDNNLVYVVPKIA